MRKLLILCFSTNLLFCQMAYAMLEQNLFMASKIALQEAAPQPVWDASMFENLHLLKASWIESQNALSVEQNYKDYIRRFFMFQFNKNFQVGLDRLKTRPNQKYPFSIMELWSAPTGAQARGYGIKFHFKLD